MKILPLQTMIVVDMQKACDGGMEFGCKNVEALTKSFEKADKAAAAAAENSKKEGRDDADL